MYKTKCAFSWLIGKRAITMPSHGKFLSKRRGKRINIKTYYLYTKRCVSSFRPEFSTININLLWKYEVRRNLAYPKLSICTKGDSPHLDYNLNIRRHLVGRKKPSMMFHRKYSLKFFPVCKRGEVIVFRYASDSELSLDIKRVQTNLFD